MSRVSRSSQLHGSGKSQGHEGKGLGVRQEYRPPATPPPPPPNLAEVQVPGWHHIWESRS